MKYNCDHRRLKKNYPFGRKSKPQIYCKDCKKVVSPKEIMEVRKRKRR